MWRSFVWLSIEHRNFPCTLSLKDYDYILINTKLFLPDKFVYRKPKTLVCRTINLLITSVRLYIYVTQNQKEKTLRLRLQGHCLPVFQSSMQGEWVFKSLLSTTNLEITQFLFFIIYYSEQGPWSAMICYEACVRLCLHSLAADGDSEASYFLKNDCVLLRNAFGWDMFWYTCFVVIFVHWPLLF